MSGRLTECLALLAVREVGPARVRRLLERLRLGGVPFERLFEPEGLRTVSEAGIQPTALLAAREAARPLAARLQEEGVHALVHERGAARAGDAHGGEPPGRAARGVSGPPILFARGHVPLLDALGVGFCGSRQASPRGLEVAADIAAQVANAGVNVVSGGARGIDAAAHEAALSAGGTTTVVLAEGLLDGRVRKSILDLAEPERLLVVSEFAPEARWAGGRAMQRNRTICALSRAMVLVEARPGSGTMAAGEDALRMGLPLFTVDFAEPSEANAGNRDLLARGAQALRQSRALGRANVQPVLDCIRSEDVPDRQATAIAEQRALWE